MCDSIAVVAACARPFSPQCGGDPMHGLMYVFSPHVRGLLSEVGADI